MKTFFAAAERVSSDELESEIGVISRSPLVDGLLTTISGLLAVIDEHRQILAVNHSFMKMLGISDPESVLGMRPGEALQCQHCNGDPAGCGTTEFCTTCGAAVAIVSSLRDHRPVQRYCAIRSGIGGVQRDIVFLVRSQPLQLGERRFLLVLLRDVTREQNHASLQRAFFHDLNNIVTSLMGNGQMLVMENDSARARTVLRQTRRLATEISLQRMITSDAADHHPLLGRCITDGIVDELRSFFITHPATGTRSMVFNNKARGLVLVTDMNLLQRVLCNMVLNALEATPPDGLVKFGVEIRDDAVRFSVWNRTHMPENVQRRIFQRNFSTKEQPGRGLGTFSMKLLGEKFLGGSVGFSSSPEDGTTFWISIPLQASDK